MRKDVTTAWIKLIDKNEIIVIRADKNDIYWLYSTAEPTIPVADGQLMRLGEQVGFVPAAENVYIAAGKATTISTS